MRPILSNVSSLFRSIRKKTKKDLRIEAAEQGGVASATKNPRPSSSTTTSTAISSTTTTSSGTTKEDMIRSRRRRNRALTESEFNGCILPFVVTNNSSLERILEAVETTNDSGGSCGHKSKAQQTHSTRMESHSQPQPPQSSQSQPPRRRTKTTRSLFGRKTGTYCRICNNSSNTATSKVKSVVIAGRSVSPTPLELLTTLPSSSSSSSSPCQHCSSCMEPSKAIRSDDIRQARHQSSRLCSNIDPSIRVLLHTYLTNNKKLPPVLPANKGVRSTTTTTKTTTTTTTISTTRPAYQRGNSWDVLLRTLQRDRRRSHNLALTAEDFEKIIIPNLLVVGDAPAPQ